MNGDSPFILIIIGISPIMSIGPVRVVIRAKNIILADSIVGSGTAG